MTGPVGDAVGVAYADLRFRGDKAPKDVANILDDASDAGDREMQDIGDKWGDSLDKRLKTSTKDTGRDVARGISAGIEREGFKITRETLKLDKNGNVGQRWVTLVAEDVEKAVTSGPGSTAAKKAGEAVTTAIGAGFNVSGKSPLIALLVPVIGIIVELVGAALQAAAAVSALLFLIPNLVFALGAEAGTLLLAFQGVGEAIKGAFAATNADELKKALENLTPSAQAFVKSLLPLKDLFSQLKATAQEGFFSKLGDAFTTVFNKESPLFFTLSSGIEQLAGSLGGLANKLILFLGDPAFLQFVSWIIPQITTWLDKFGPSMITFLTGLSNIGFALLPFFVWFGGVVNDALAGFGQWLDDLSHDQGFLDWLQEVEGDLRDVWSLFKSAGALIKAFFVSLNGATEENGGFVTALTDQLDKLTLFFQSPLGEGFLRGIISIAVALSQILVGLALVVGLVVVGFEGLRMAAVDLWNWLGKVFGIIDDGSEKTKILITTFATEAIAALTSFKDGAIALFSSFRDNVVSFFTDARDNVVGAFSNAIDTVRNFFTGLPDTIANAVGSLSSTLWNAGSNLIQGLIDGALSKLGPLKSAFSWLMQNGVLSFLPHSPAKEGPLSGQGDPMIAGATIVERIATGMTMEAPTLQDASASATSSVLLGTGAVQMNFYGQTPTNAQAGGLGAAAGNSLATTLAQRNTQLAVRSLGSVS